MNKRNHTATVNTAFARSFLFGLIVQPSCPGPNGNRHYRHVKFLLGRARKWAPISFQKRMGSGVPRPWRLILPQGHFVWCSTNTSTTEPSGTNDTPRMFRSMVDGLNPADVLQFPLFFVTCSRISSGAAQKSELLRLAVSASEDGSRQISRA